MGLGLYLNIFVVMYFHFKKYIRNIVKNDFSKILKSIFFVLLITQFATSFGGQMYAITFRSIIFLYLGAIIGNLKTLNLKL